MSDTTRTSMFGASVRCRLTEAQMAAAEERARRQGMTMSELVRHALRRELREAA